MLADLGTDKLNQAAYQAVVDTATRAVGEALQGITELQARLGTAQERVKNANDRMSIQIDIMTNHIGALEGVDPYEASSRLSSLLTQVETAYAMTARIQQLTSSTTCPPGDQPRLGWKPMYQFSYAEVLDETPKGARERERQAIDRSIELLREAEAQGVRSRAAVEAILFVRRLWGYLIEDLARPDNDLPQKLRADLISIGLWIMREAEQIRLETSSNFKGLIDVSTAIRDGLE